MSHGFSPTGLHWIAGKERASPVSKWVQQTAYLEKRILVKAFDKQTPTMADS